MCPGFAEFNSRLAHVSVSQCRKFCDDAPSFAMLSTLDTPQDLDPDDWRQVFRFSELWHMGAQVSNNVALMVCRCSELLKQEVTF